MKMAFKPFTFLVHTGIVFFLMLDLNMRQPSLIPIFCPDQIYLS